MHWKTLLHYYGSKSKIVHDYSPPDYDRIIEPFAGGASYALRYHARRVTLIDKDPTVCAIWRYLIQTPVEEVLRTFAAVPRLGDDIRTFYSPTDPLAVRAIWQMETNHGNPGYMTMIHVTKFAARWFPALQKRLRYFLPKIRHWEITEGDYMLAPDVEATWFIDPPYQVKGKRYTASADALDYDALGRWVRGRRGQVIACENEGATWLPFLPFRNNPGRPRSRPAAEVVYLQDTNPLVRLEPIRRKAPKGVEEAQTDPFVNLGKGEGDAV